MVGVPPIPPATRAVIAALLTVPPLLTWPMARVFSTHVLAAADQEAAPHIWGLWAAGQAGHLLQIETSLQAFPEGIELVLVDQRASVSVVLELGEVAGEVA